MPRVAGWRGKMGLPPTVTGVRQGLLGLVRVDYGEVVAVRAIRFDDMFLGLVDHHGIRRRHAGVISVLEEGQVSKGTGRRGIAAAGHFGDSRAGLGQRQTRRGVWIRSSMTGTSWRR